jgi:two-component system cell cycle response regulator DivK
VRADQRVRKTVLIVDDAESICMALASVLEVHGYAVLAAYDGEQGVRLAQENQPDVILLDIMMPVLDGWGAIRRLKSDARTSAIPVIALTALRLTEDQVQAAGFTGYLSKPVTPHRLREEIQGVSRGNNRG